MLAKVNTGAVVEVAVRLPLSRLIEKTPNASESTKPALNAHL
jgi:hypothetical protein